MSFTKYKNSLKNIKEKDPEFYKFLQEQDGDLLNVDQSDEDDEQVDSEDGGTSSENDDDESERKIVNEGDESRRLRQNLTTKKVKKRGQIDDKTLEDEIMEKCQSEDEDEDEGSEKFEENEETVVQKIFLTKSILGQWEQNLSSDKPNKNVIKQLISAFRAVVAKTGGDVPPSSYQLADNATFNTVLRLCFTHFPSAWLKAMKISDPLEENVGKTKLKLLKPLIKDYIFDMIKFLPEIQEQQVLSVVLKHFSRITHFFVPFARKSKTILKVLIAVWSSKPEECKILAFVCIMKLVKRMQNEYLDFALRRMYLTFVKSTTIITPRGWSGINFMQKSYAELCALNLELTYQQAFLYIRQLAIFLRNAIMSKKKETVRAVYNWQYVLCLCLWSRVLNNLKEEETLQPLVYPLIQVIIGCCRLIPTTKFIPLRFHCVKCLMILTENTEIFVPVLPLIVEILECVNFDKRHNRQSLKPLDFECLIKLSKSQLDENHYKVAAVEQACDLLVENVYRFQNNPAFTDLTFCLVVRVTDSDYCTDLKRFCKKCTAIELCRKVKLLSMKIQDHCKWMEEKKALCNISLNDYRSLSGFDHLLRTKLPGGPFEKYYESYEKLKQREARIKAMANNKVDEETEATTTKRKDKDKGSTMKKEEKVKLEKQVDKNASRKTLDFAPDMVMDFDLSDL